MTIANVLAMYKTAPLVLVVESAEGTVCELSLADLHGAGHRLMRLVKPPGASSESPGHTATASNR